MNKFKCAECGAPVPELKGEFLRSCGHDTAAILADIFATVYGEATVNQSTAKPAFPNPLVNNRFE